MTGTAGAGQNSPEYESAIGEETTMKKSVLTLCVLALCMTPLAPAASAASKFQVSPEIGIYRIGDESAVRYTGSTTFNLSELEDGEYAAFTFHVKNNSKKRAAMESVYARIDGGEKLAWSDGALEPGTGAYYHIFYSNMRGVSAGKHTVKFYANGRKLAGKTFTLKSGASSSVKADPPRNDDFVPTGRSPYIVCRPVFPDTGDYTEYAVDFRVDRQPTGTYLCLCNWDMDLSSLRRRYSSVYREYSGVAAYAGFQVIDDGTKLAIMSVWDTYCKDSSGRVTTIHPQVVYPANPLKNQPFGGEGNGRQCMVKYNWKAGQDYRVLIQQSVAEGSGNCLIAMWVCDLGTMSWEKLIEYDLGIPDTWMTGACTFLENYIVSTAAEYRDARFFNFRAKNNRTGKWVAAASATMEQNYDHPGSYTYGSDDDSFFCITTGLPGIWPAPKNGAKFTVKHAEKGSPY